MRKVQFTGNDEVPCHHGAWRLRQMLRRRKGTLPALKPVRRRSGSIGNLRGASASATSLHLRFFRLYPLTCSQG